MMTIGVYLYDGAEVLDFAGPYEVFTTASRIAGLDWRVILIGETEAPIQARGGMVVIPEHSITTHPGLDMLLLPGGNHQAQLTNLPVVTWIAQVAATARMIGSVCTGAFLLAETGLLQGHRVVTHWEDTDLLARSYPSLMVESGPRWIEQGQYITSAGISAGIEMSLYLVSQWASLSVARATARQMEFDWHDDGAG